MNLSDLKQLDLKDLDLAQIKDNLLERKDLLINIGLVVGTVALCFFIFNNNRNVAATAQAKVVEMLGKTDVIVQHHKSLDKIKKFKEQFPAPLNENDIVDLVTNSAIKDKVQILTYSPAQETNSGIYSRLTMQYSFIAMDYANMIQFLYDIEHTPNALRVENWNGTVDSGNLNSRGRNNSNSTEETVKRFNGQITVTAIKLNK